MKTAERKKVPELRFPEFSGEWEEKRLGEISEWKSGGTPSKDRAEYWNGDIPWISASSMHDYKIDDSEFKLSELGLKNGSRLTGKGTLLLLVRGSMLYNRIPLGMAQCDVAFNQDVKAIDAGQEMNAFLLPWLQAKEHLLLSMVTGTGIGAGKLETSELKALRVGQPVFEEQKKIASFLSAVDRRIEGLEKRRELLAAYKKGLMQKLFNQSLRFTDDNGNPFPDWTEKRLGEVGTTFNGLTNKDSSHFGTGAHYIQYKQIFDNSVIDVSGCGLVEVASGENQNAAQYGDVFFTTSSETPNEVGMASVLLDKVVDVYLNSFCFGYRPTSFEQLYPHFSRYLFRSPEMRQEIVRLAQGSTRFNMSKKEFLKIKIKFPCLEEQKKIADCLSALDHKIEQLETQVERTRKFKQGLLQKMFV